MIHNPHTLHLHLMPITLVWLIWLGILFIKWFGEYGVDIIEERRKLKAKTYNLNRKCGRYR